MVALSVWVKGPDKSLYPLPGSMRHQVEDMDDDDLLEFLRPLIDQAIAYEARGEVP